ncbi:MAG: hypothetical protein K2Q22_03975, partial [Cytophagales bacterium]|nr:hypothetical protein [Cytophagales bacterium]
MAFKLVEYFFYFLTSAVAICSLGYGILSMSRFLPKSKSNFTQLFVSYALGIILLTVGFSIIYTQGRTILLFIVPIGAYLVYLAILNRDLKPILREYPISAIFWVIIFVLVFSFGVKILPYVSFENQTLDIPHSDYVFYSIISQMMSVRGQENTYTIANILSPGQTGISPYHYAELWLSVLVAKAFSANYLLSLIIVVYPLLLAGWILAILAFWEIFEHLRWRLVYMSILLLFVGGLHFNFYFDINFMSLTGVFSRNFLTELGDKYGYVYLIFSLSILFLNYWCLEAAFVILLMIPFVFAAAVPGIFGAFPFLVLVFHSKFNNPIRTIGIWLFCLIGYFAFYYFLGGNMGQSNDLNIDFVQSIAKFQSLKSIRTSFNIIAGTSIQLLILYGLWMVFLIGMAGRKLVWSEIKNPLAIFILATFFFGLLTWAVLFEIMDLVQLVNGCGILLLNAYLVYLIIKTIISKWPELSQTKKYCAIAFAMVIVCIQFSSKNFISHYFLKSMYDKTYEETVKSTIKIPKKGEYIFIANQESSFDNIFSLLSYHKLSTHFIYLHKNQLLPICIDDFDVHIAGLPSFEKAIADKIKRSGFFYQYVQYQKQSGKFVSIDQSRADLLDSLKINYLALGYNTPISPELAQKFTLLAVDKKSGEKFYR